MTFFLKISIFFKILHHTQATPMTLKLMEEHAQKGALCLDGTAAGFFFAPASKNENTHANWLIFFTGGGWCSTLMDCYDRSFTPLGSSLHWDKTLSTHGLMSDQYSVNPDFYNFNRVQIAYCDGSSFSSDRSEPMIVNNKSLYFRGKRILDAVLKTLVDQYHLNQAENILISGCSAGGLAAFFHADYIFSRVQHFPNLRKYKVAPLSGFFLPFIFNFLQVSFFNASKTLKSANDSYVRSNVPFFIQNSVFDQYQALTVHAIGAPCLLNTSTCTREQMTIIHAQVHTFISTITDSKSPFQPSSRPGNGFFLHASITHCEGQNDELFNSLTINGTSLRQAIGLWWARPDSTPAIQNLYVEYCVEDFAVGVKSCPTCIPCHFEGSAGEVSPVFGLTSIGLILILLVTLLLFLIVALGAGSFCKSRV